MSEQVRDWKYSLTIRKHIPSGHQYTPADEISATVTHTASDEFLRFGNSEKRINGIVA
jgi:hypothetical protein